MGQQTNVYLGSGKIGEQRLSLVKRLMRERRLPSISAVIQQLIDSVEIKIPGGKNKV